MIYAVGDIHGHHRKLVTLLHAINFGPDDRVVFIGDYIDRGPDTYEVIETLIRMREFSPGSVFLRGNHEQMMLDARESIKSRRLFSFGNNEVALWFGNGGTETIDSYGARKRGWIGRVPDEHWEFVESTTLEFRLDGFVFVHAGLLPPECEDADLPAGADPRLWIREPFLSSEVDFGARVIFGHTPQASGWPLVMANKIGIDTGVAYGGPLTAVALDPEKPDWYKVYQV